MNLEIKKISFLEKFAFFLSKIDIKTIFACIIFTGCLFYYVIPETRAESAGVFSLSGSMILFINLLGYFFTSALFLFVLTYIFKKNFSLNIDLSVFLICIYVIWCLLSIMISASDEYKKDGIAYIVYILKLLGVFAAMLYVLKNKEHKFIINCILTVVMFNLVLSFAQIIIGEGDKSGLFLDSNKYGRFLVIAHSLFFMYFLTTKSAVKKIFLILLLAIMCLDIFFIRSRGTYILYLYTTAVIIWQTRNKKIIVIGIFILFFIGALFGYMTLQRIQKDKMSIRNDSDIGRISTMVAGFNMWKAHPVFGIGYGTSPSQYSNYQDKGVFGFSNMTVIHNIYVAQLAETGIIGFLLFCAFNGVTILRLIKKHKKDGGIYCNIYPLFYLIAITVFLLHGLVYHTFEIEGYYWFILAAAILSLGDKPSITHNIKRGGECK